MRQAKAWCIVSRKWLRVVELVFATEKALGQHRGEWVLEPQRCAEDLEGGVLEGIRCMR